MNFVCNIFEFYINLLVDDPKLTQEHDVQAMDGHLLLSTQIENSIEERTHNTANLAEIHNLSGNQETMLI